MENLAESAYLRNNGNRKFITRAERVCAGIAMLKSCMGMFDFHYLIERVYYMGIDFDN